MRRLSLLLIFTTLLLAHENPTILLPWVGGFLLTCILFFWGIYKTLKTQKKIYLYALVPFIALMGAMFLI